MKAIPQDVLKKEYERLVFNRRASPATPPPASATYVLRNGAIEAYRKNGNLLGVALLEPESLVTSGEKFYGKIPYPRQEPDPAVLKQLYEATRAEIVQNYPEAIALAPNYDRAPAAVVKAGSCSGWFGKVISRLGLRN